jgi:hypothetical protein
VDLRTNAECSPAKTASLPGDELLFALSGFAIQNTFPRYRKVASINHSGKDGRVQTRFAVMTGLLRELGLPETLPLIKLSPQMQEWIVGQAAVLQRDAMAHATVAVLVEYGLPLTRENYLNLNNVDEDDLDAEQDSELPQLFRQSMVEEQVASVMFDIEIDDTLRRLSEGAR